MATQVWRYYQGQLSCVGRAVVGADPDPGDGGGDGGDPGDGGGGDDTTQIGSLPVGQASYTVPAGALFVSPSGSDSATGTESAPLKTLAKAAAVVADGGTVVMRAGEYHESMSIGNGLNKFTVQNYPNEAVWFDGSQVVTTWTKSGNVWVHSGIPTKFYRSGTSGWSAKTGAYPDGNPYADYSDQVFLDGVLLNQIADGATPAAGQFSVDYSANTITIGSDPTGHEVRVSDLKYLLVSGTRISFKGVGIRRYSPDYESSVTAPLYYGGSSAGTLIENVVVTQSAMWSIYMTKKNAIIRYVTSRDNNYAGFGCTTCDGLLIENCYFTGLNRGKFRTAPETGCIKVTRCRGVTVRNCLAKDNNGANGIWTDVRVAQANIVNNIITGNHRVGIQQEEGDGGFFDGVQYYGVTAGNVIDGPQFGMQVFGVGHTAIYNNLFMNCGSLYISMEQDRAVKTTTDWLTPEEAPGDNVQNRVTNNIYGPGSPIQNIRCWDSWYNRSAHDQGNSYRNSLWTTGGPNTIIQWGTADKSWINYNTVSAFETAEPTLASGNAKGTLTDDGAEPLPDYVATALGQSTGTKKIGPFIQEDSYVPTDA